MLLFISMRCNKRVWAFSHHSAMENPIPFYVFPFHWGHLTSLTTAHPLQRVTRSRGALFTRDLWGQTAWWQCWASVSLKHAQQNHWRNPNSSFVQLFCTVEDICRMCVIFFFFFWSSLSFYDFFLYFCTLNHCHWSYCHPAIRGSIVPVLSSRLVTEPYPVFSFWDRVEG